MIEVIDGKIAERESFITRIDTLSIPGALFVDIALLIRSTCSHFAVEWEANSSEGGYSRGTKAGSFRLYIYIYILLLYYTIL